MHGHDTLCRHTFDSEKCSTTKLLHSAIDLVCSEEGTQRDPVVDNTVPFAASNFPILEYAAPA